MPSASVSLSTLAVCSVLTTASRLAVEFYFDDANLPYDKFMWKLHSQTPEHWIPIATVASFKRMREFTRKHHHPIHTTRPCLTRHV